MQLEPGSVEGAASLAEHRIRLCVQGDMDEKWSDRFEEDDKFFNEQVRDIEFDCRTTESGGDELEKEKKMASAATTVATSSGGGGSTIGHGIPRS